MKYNQAMRAQQILILLLFFSALPALAQKVYIDYDHATAFSEYKTFQFRETRDDLRDTAPHLHQTVVEQLRGYAKEGGLEEVESNPDVYVAYYTADRGRLRLVLGNLDYTYGPSFSLGSYWEGGVGTRTPDSFTFKEGTLIIDIWEADGKRLVWRGMATAALSKNPDKKAQKLDKALKKLTKDWEKMYGGYVRKLRKYKATQEE
jgi:hypothetical protein